MRKTIFALLILLAIVSVDASFGSAQSNKPLLIRQPTMSRTHIVFSYAGDLWIAPRGGGEASRLTTGVGAESSPQFSPDGTTVAFTGEGVHSPSSFRSFLATLPASSISVIGKLSDRDWREVQARLQIALAVRS